MIEMIRQGLKADGIDVSTSKLCQWFEVPRRSNRRNYNQREVFEVFEREGFLPVFMEDM